MLYLGDWQLRRAESGNELSWAYTFEWPIFAICGIAFWVKSLRDELGPQSQESSGAGPGGTETGGTETGGTETGGTETGGTETGAAETADDYTARLKAEVQGHGRWHGIR